MLVNIYTDLIEELEESIFSRSVRLPGLKS